MRHHGRDEQTVFNAEATKLARPNLRPSALSVDVVNICNLRCKHCFWDSYDDIIPDKINLRILEPVKKILRQFPSITNITWYGGEPLVNAASREILRKGIGLNVKNNLIITNGTFPLSYLGPTTHYAVSLDGTEAMHDDIRGRGVYHQAKQNIRQALSKGIPVGVIYCINAQNIDCIAPFLVEWQPSGIDGVTFTFYTPILNKPSALAVTPRQREALVPHLQKLKKQYGGFIYNTPYMIELLRKKYSKELAENCPMNYNNRTGRIHSLHMCNDGSLRIPCALGPNADHLQCRNVTKLALYAGMVKKDKATLRALFGMYHSKTHSSNTPSTLN